MARGERLEAALRARIVDSGHTLILHYPPVRTPTTGTSPGAAPLNPLTGNPPAQALIDTSTVTPVKPAKTIPCLWVDAFVSVKTRSSASLAKQTRDFGKIGWVEGAEALARVLLADVLDDPDNPQGPNAFTDVAYVEHAGRKYHVIGSDPISSGFRDPISLYVWLMGAEGQ